MVDIYLALYPFVIGGLIIIFNERLVRFQLELQTKRKRTVDKKLVKTQLYIAGGLFLFLGFFNLGWSSGFFSK